MKTIKLSDADANLLLMALGMAVGSTRAEHAAPELLLLSDKILVQVSDEAYTYSQPRERVLLLLKQDGIEL